MSFLCRLNRYLIGLFCHEIWVTILLGKVKVKEAVVGKLERFSAEAESQ